MAHDGQDGERARDVEADVRSPASPVPSRAAGSRSPGPTRAVSCGPHRNSIPNEITEALKDAKKPAQGGGSPGWTDARKVATTHDNSR